MGYLEIVAKQIFGIAAAEKVLLLSYVISEDVFFNDEIVLWH